MLACNSSSLLIRREVEKGGVVVGLAGAWGGGVAAMQKAVWGEGKRRLEVLLE